MINSSDLGIKLEVSTGSIQKSSFEISLYKQSGIISLIFFGCVSYEDYLSAIEDLSKKASLSGAYKIFINICETTFLLTIDEQQFLGKYLAAKLHPSRNKIAVVHTPLSNPCSIIHITAFGHGLKIAEFIDEAEAIDWLK